MFLWQTTTLKYVNLSWRKNKIIIDFPPLYNYLATKRKDEYMVNVLKTHVNAIDSLSKWTSFKAVRLSDCEVEITLNL